jgi:hypothetical protein
MRVLLIAALLAALLCATTQAQRIVQPVINTEVACKDYDVLGYMRTLIATQDKARYDLYGSGDCIDLAPGLFVTDETSLMQRRKR